VSVARLVELVRERPPIVVLTGAGISTESGIPDFRSSRGIWSGVDPMAVASIEAFERDPGAVWHFYETRLHAHAGAEPNAGHRALAELEQGGLVRAVITQNVDGLHTRAGSREVVEVHGSLDRAVCPACGLEQASSDALAQLDARPVPLCPACGSPLKPGVVLFGELLPRAAFDRALELARAAPLMLVVGSSLEVWPVAGLPLESGAFAIVNRGSTQLDDRAALTLDAPAGATLTALAEALAG